MKLKQDELEKAKSALESSQAECAELKKTAEGFEFIEYDLSEEEDKTTRLEQELATAKEERTKHEEQVKALEDQLKTMEEANRQISEKEKASSIFETKQVEQLQT